MKMGFLQLTLFLLFHSFISAQNGSNHFRIFMAGNSTMADKPYSGSNPEKGWGQVFPLYFKEGVKVENHAVNGRSTKSFIDEGKWDSLINKVEPGDYIIIEFGHNDAKQADPARYAAPHTDYKNNLIRFVKDVRAKGGKPVLATPIGRRSFNEDGQYYDTHGDYPWVVRNVAGEMNVPLLDLHKKSEEMIKQFGEEESKKLFLHTKPGEYERFLEGKTDDTHFSATGAFKFCDLAAEEIMEKIPELAEWLKK